MVTIAARAPNLRSPLGSFARHAEKAIPAWPVPLVQRLGIAAVLFLSGRTQAECWFTLTDSTFFLFETEYQLLLMARGGGALSVDRLLRIP